MQTANLLGFRSIWEKNKTGDSSKSLGFLFDLHMNPLEIPQNPGSGACSRGPVSNEIKTYVERRKNSMRNAPLPGGNPQMSNAKKNIAPFSASGILFDRRTPTYLPNPHRLIL